MGENTKLFGGIEVGGTKVVCAIGNAHGELLDQTRIQTRDPRATLADIFRYFAGAEVKIGTVSAFGLSTFGPVELHRNSPSYGHITTTPKPGWQHTDLLGQLTRGLGRPIEFDTDVNGAALAELVWGAGQGLDSLAYVTVGTGIGAGVVHGGKPVHGLIHPEVGHIMVRRHGTDGGFAGICPFHGDCLEGLASGPAIVARSGRTLNDAATGDLIWAIEADYLGQLCASLTLMHSPQRIFLGGGVMQQRCLFPAIRARMLHWLNGYLSSAELQQERFISAPGLGDEAGIKGALVLAVRK